MSFVWVQQWVALPVVYEGQMGDIPTGTRTQALEGIGPGNTREGQQGLSSSPYKSTDNNTAFYSQLSSLPQSQGRTDFRSTVNVQAQYPLQEHGASPLHMGSMMSALPDYGLAEDSSNNMQGQQPPPLTLPGAPNSTVVYQLGQNIQLAGHGHGNMSPQPPYPSGYAGAPYQQGFATSSQNNPHATYQNFNTNVSRMHPGVPMQPQFQGYQQAPQYMYYSPPYGSQAQFSPGYPAPGAQSQVNYDRKGSLDYPSHDGIFPAARGGTSGTQAPFPQGNGMPRSGQVSSIPRGPPRKPKQSGHALWVGNLPPGTTVVNLKDHFSREATKDIESLFLISKSNCAFVNYRTETSCTAAMHRFHDSRFNGVRLVCRLRRSSAPASGVPTGPSAMVGAQQSTTSPPETPQLDGEMGHTSESVHQESLQHNEVEESGAPRSSNSLSKFFIVKSLTLQDLELSVRNGIWATQSHNEDVLNKAFRVRACPCKCANYTNI